MTTNTQVAYACALDATHPASRRSAPSSRSMGRPTTTQNAEPHTMRCFEPRPVRRKLIMGELRMAWRLLVSALPGTTPAQWPDSGRLARLGAALHRVNSRWGA
jgi:hypothetical protein